MPARRVVGVIAVEKRDPVDLIGDPLDRVEIAEDETASTAVAA
jgi:hypothetical protein